MTCLAFPSARLGQPWRRRRGRLQRDRSQALPPAGRRADRLRVLRPLLPCLPDSTGTFLCPTTTPNVGGIVCVGSGLGCTATGVCCTGLVCATRRELDLRSALDSVRPATLASRVRTDRPATTTPPVATACNAPTRRRTASGGAERLHLRHAALSGDTIRAFPFELFAARRPAPSFSIRKSRIAVIQARRRGDRSGWRRRC